MVNFEFRNPTKIIFGKDSEINLGEEIKKYGKKVLLHYGVGSIIDSAKGIAVGILYEGNVWDFYSGEKIPETTIPVGVVLTIPAAGSESSYSSVVTNDDGKLKRPLDNDVIYPVFAVMNPEFTYSLPAYQTSCGMADILAHLMERYFTNVRNVGITDRLLEGAMKNIIDNAYLVQKEPHNYAVRSEIMWTGSIAHSNLLNTGRIGDWACHMIEHELSAFNDVAHGAGLAIMFPAWMKYVYKHDMDIFVQFAVRVWGIEQSYFDKERTILACIEKIEDFLGDIGLPVRLSEIGIEEADFDEIAGKCRMFDETTVGNFVKLTKADIINILNLAK